MIIKHVDDDGYSITANKANVLIPTTQSGNVVGYAYPCSGTENGWRLYSLYGKCMNSGYKAFKNPKSIEDWFFRND